MTQMPAIGVERRVYRNSMAHGSPGVLGNGEENVERSARRCAADTPTPTDCFSPALSGIDEVAIASHRSHPDDCQSRPGPGRYPSS